MRGSLTWALTLPLLPIGVLAGHAVGYELADREPRPHGYLGLRAALPRRSVRRLSSAGFVARIVRIERGLAGPAPAWIFAAFPPLAFLAQEY